MTLAPPCTRSFSASRRTHSMCSGLAHEYETRALGPLPVENGSAVVAKTKGLVFAIWPGFRRAFILCSRNRFAALRYSAFPTFIDSLVCAPLTAVMFGPLTPGGMLKLGAA